MLSKIFSKQYKIIPLIQRGYGSHFTHVPEAPPDKILGLNELYNADKNPNKINLGVGAYRDNEGKPWVLPCVKEAEKKIFGMDHEYGVIAGSPEFTKLSTKFIYGNDSPVLKDNRVCAVQALSGTGSLALIAHFLAKFSNVKDIYVPNPTWGNHFNIFRSAGLNTGVYRYLDNKKFAIDINQTIEDINAAKKESIFMFHACAHNPTGFDPSQDEWKAISEAIKKNNHLILFDCAYQGFASGDANKDAWAIRYFVEQGHNILLAQSFAKNFGLYGERIGCASIVTESIKENKIIMSQLKTIVRSLWSNPPLYGCRIVTEILKDINLSKQWYKECKVMADRIILMRKLLVNNIKETGNSNNWDHICKQIGMFAYTGLNKEQVNIMINKHHIYLTEDGRISMAGVNTHNVKRISECINDVMK